MALGIRIREDRIHCALRISGGSGGFFVSLIYFHRFLITAAILFGAYFAWHLWGRYGLSGASSDLWGAVGAGVITLGLLVYLPTIKGRRQVRSNA